MTFNTQSSSKPRLKNDTLGNDALQQLYQLFETTKDITEFKQICEKFVQDGGGKQPRKDEIIAAIKRSTSRAEALTKAQNFIMAGMGLGA